MACGVVRSKISKLEGKENHKMRFTIPGLLAKADGWLPIALLALSLSVNGYLMWRVKAPSGPVREHLKIGQLLPSMNANELDGGHATLAWGDESKDTVLYVFRPDCIRCKRNLQNLRTVVADQGANYKFVGVSLTNEGLKEYLQTTPLPFSVVSVGSDTAKAFKLGVTPETVVISPDGKIRKVWQGAFADAVQTEVEATFNVQLPGLAYAGSTPAVTH